MSFDFLAQGMREATTITALNNIRHAFLGRARAEDLKTELEALSEAFSPVTPEKMSRIIVGQMTFSSPDVDNLAFEISNALSDFLQDKYNDASVREQMFDTIRDISTSLQNDPNYLVAIPIESRDLLLSFLNHSISHIAARDTLKDVNSPLNATGL